jgi:MFS family permease
LRRGFYQREAFEARSDPETSVGSASMAEPAPSFEPARASNALPAAPFQGWRIVLVAAACHALGFGLLGVLGFANTPITAEFGATQLQMGLGLSVSILSPALCGAPLGWLLDRGPLRAIMLGGLAIMLLGAVLMSQAPSLAALAVAFMVVTVGMSMYGHFPAHVMIVNWYVIRRGQALAIATIGLSVASFLVPQIASRLIPALGWRHALLAIAFGAAMLAAPLFATFAVKRPEDVGQHPDGLPPLERKGTSQPGLVEIPIARVLRDPAFWLVGIGISLAYCTSIPGFYLVRYMEAELGITPVQAALVPSTQAVAGLVGKLIAGWAVDRVDKRAVVLTALGVHALGWVVAVQQSSIAGLMLAGVPLGLGGGGFLPLAPAVQGACFGRAMIGRVNGLHALLALPFLLGIAPLVGWMQHLTGSFVLPFLGLAGVCVLAALAFALVRMPETEPGL